MSGPIIMGEALITLPSARISRCDVQEMRGASDLLAEARRIREQTETAHEAARAEGYEEGKQAARNELAKALCEALEKLSVGFAEENAKRNAKVAEAAMEVVNGLIGKRDNVEVVTGLATQALKSLGAGQEDCVVQLAPDLVAPVTERTSEKHALAQIVPNDALGPLGCRVLTADGVIVADLDTQLKTLRTRWGLIEADEAES